MTSMLVQIRGVDPRTRDELAARAARRGMSLTAYLRELLEREVATPDLAEVLGRVGSRSESSSASAVDIIRMDRDRR